MDADEKIPDKLKGNESKQSEPAGANAADPKSRRDAAAPPETRPRPAAPESSAEQAAAMPEPAVTKETTATAARASVETPEVATRAEGVRTPPAPPAAAQTPAESARPSVQAPAELKTPPPALVPITDPSGLGQPVPALSAPANVASVSAAHESDQTDAPHRPNRDMEIFSDEEAERRIRAKSRRSFLWGAVAVAGAWAGLEWLGARRTDKMIPWPFRRVLEVNENLSRDLFSGTRLAPEFPKDAAQMPRPNGSYGVAEEEQPDWELRLVGLADMSAAKMPEKTETEADTTGDEEPAPYPADKRAPVKPPADKKGGAKPPADKKGGARPPVAVTQDAGADSSDESGASDSAPVVKEPAVVVSMKDIRALPRTEIVTELKCIEGWSTVVHWAGVRLVDFMRKYPPATKSGDAFDPKRLDDLPEYVSMETPTGAYFVGLDMASALHPQTILCYEMNGKPLALEHGAPLRLAIPVKYGIKNIKNIGKIKFTDERPRDYWAELGYDWYAGH